MAQAAQVALEWAYPTKKKARHASLFLFYGKDQQPLRSPQSLAVLSMPWPARWMSLPAPWTVLQPESTNTEPAKTNAQMKRFMVDLLCE